MQDIQRYFWDADEINGRMETIMVQSFAEVMATAKFIPIDRMNPLFDAVIQSVDEAVLNALVANETMVGADDHEIEALPHDAVRDILGSHGRLVDV